jgi:hypothetical protein
LNNFLKGLLMAGCSRILLVLLLGIMLLTACGSMKPVPAEFNPTEYTPISFDQLLHDSSLRAGELVRVEGFFWQFLTYDPALKHYYANQLKYPRHWGDLEWFALYEKADMKGYYDRGAMSHRQRLQFEPKRLDHFILYGEMVPMGGSKLYLLVHHLDRLKID